MNPHVFIKTHGCKLNQADSIQITDEFSNQGFNITAQESDAQVVILNTCTVTATADSKARQYINRIKRTNPDALVVVTGCYAELSPETIKQEHPDCLVLGNKSKKILVSEVKNHFQHNIQLGQITSTPMLKTRAMLKIQEGCNQVCAYCIVPKVRGREKSIPSTLITNQINNFHKNGYQEVVLTGTQLGTYGFDLQDENLVTLISTILRDTSVPRIRISSLQAHEISTELLSLWSNHRLLNHLHIPLQSGDDSILESMRRRYTTSVFSDSVELARNLIPNVSITTDWIVGFPGETNDQFEKSTKFVKSMGFSDIHAFPYSIRPGTSAAHFKNQITPETKKIRMIEALAQKSDSSERYKQSMIGKSFDVLWESTSSTTYNYGLTSNYIKVKKMSDETVSNSITNETLLKLDGKEILTK
ncbi:MAG TPA: tRNA (N(6)-L-threonylcarbamoyladenosine(37)-C(2))-methylthiotransferase MtaB [Dehalococcoidia bacterium]|nr:tRNA (N(6)-L-threonylcarbamoyladenosine(37)-C(2))-methylthiotransferase MtaB [Dehalococcoidia bacterium]|tara:strand:- start:4240 stop:5490 length:1251 start_codon:yes stop_codon:yes gene_type:complete